MTFSKSENKYSDMEASESEMKAAVASSSDRLYQVIASAYELPLNLVEPTTRGEPES